MLSVGVEEDRHMVLDVQALCKRSLDGKAKVSDVFREAKIVATRHRLRDLQDWIDDELSGYTSGRRLLEYRKVGGTLKYSRDGRNWGVLQIENRELREILSTHWLNHPIDELERYADGPPAGKTFVVPFPLELIRGAVKQGIQLPDDTGLEITSHEIARLVAAVRNELLNRLLTTENDGFGESPNIAEWDVFISHASEDKEAFVRPLAECLQRRQIKVWFDEFTLSIGDSLRGRSIGVWPALALALW